MTYFFSQTSPDKGLLNKQSNFYDFKTTFGWFKGIDMFIRYIISPPKIVGLSQKVNCVKISSFREKNQL